MLRLVAFHGMAPNQPTRSSDSNDHQPPLFQEFPDSASGWLSRLPIPKDACSPKVLGGAVLLLAVGIAAAGVLWGVNRVRPTGGSAARADEMAAAAIAAERAKAEEQTARDKTAAEQRERAAVARVQLMSARDSALDALRVIEACGQEYAAWQSDVAPLLSNDRGRKIACKPEWVALFAALHSQHRPNPTEPEAARARVQALLEPIEQSLASESPAYLPGEAAINQIVQERSAASKFVEAYRSGRTSIAAIAAQADRLDTLSPQTLESALADLGNKHAEERAQKVATETELARQDADRRLAEAEAQRRRQETEDAAKRIEAQKEADRLAAEAETLRVRNEAQRQLEREREQQERERLAMLARSDDVRTTLKPFVSPGTWNPGRRTSSAERRPMSLNALKAKGALNPDDNGYRMLVAVANAKENDRPHWSIAYLQSKTFAKATEGQRREVVKAQKYLNELGPTLVELGLLSE